jgi:very-short-patch-repair endonuclease
VPHFSVPPSFKGKGVRGLGSDFFMNRRGKIVRGQTVNAETLLLAKRLRREMTLAERRLWKALRRNAADGFHFRRQQIIEGFIVDFYCSSANLAIEVDGAVHGDQREYDELRSGVLAQQGVQVVRISNEAMYEVEAVIEFIKEKIEEALLKKASR